MERWFPPTTEVLENRAKHYIFWLAEYRNRQLYAHVGNHAPWLIYFFWDCYNIRGFKPQGELSGRILGEFIQSEEWVSCLNDSGLVRRFGKDIHANLKNASSEITLLSQFLLEKNTDIDFLFYCRKPTSPEKIVEMYLNEEIHTYVRPSFETFGNAFALNSAITIMNEDGEIVDHESIHEIKDEKIFFRNMSINFNANMEDIFSEMVLYICNARRSAACRDLPDDSDESLNALLENGCPGYGPCAGGKCEKVIGFTLPDAVLRRAKLNRYLYTERSDAARTVGIWLWDYIHENGGSAGAAVREIKKQEFLTHLQFRASPDRVLERIYSKTRECIEQGVVFSMC